MQKFYLYICTDFFHIPLYPEYNRSKLGAVTKLIQRRAATELLIGTNWTMERGRSQTDYDPYKFEPSTIATRFQYSKTDILINKLIRLFID